jgi:NADPH-dependent 2,4-dienoyl-CoA reductase/sulfur reductase-like enzyme
MAKNALPTQELKAEGAVESIFCLNLQVLVQLWRWDKPHAFHIRSEPLCFARMGIPVVTRQPNRAGAHICGRQNRCTTHLSHITSVLVWSRRVNAYAQQAKNGSQGTADSHETDVVVIGAGVGGLSCAGMLAKYGVDVTVLESQTICGGAAHVRICILDSPLESFTA